MIERPILFSAPMVPPTLSGVKTVTRRLDDRYGKLKVGDRLWGKETWRMPKNLDGVSPTEAGKRALEAGYTAPWAPIKYEADDFVNSHEEYLAFGGGSWGKTRVSIHMPRWASRITLELVEDPRKERLHEISEVDAQREGVPRDTEPCDHARRLCRDTGCMEPTYRSSFAELWTKLHGEGSWDANPFVWRLAFKRIYTARGCAT